VIVQQVVPLNVQMASWTDAGARTYNEDDLRAGPLAGKHFAVLSDGAGGHRDGAVASDIVVRLVELALQSPGEFASEVLHGAIHDAHRALLDQQQGRPDRERMHATVVALWIDAQQGAALWSHVGDSRLYMLRRGRVHHVTKDDSVVQHMIDAGILTPDAARTHPRKHHLVCAMGVESDFSAHTLERSYPLQDGDAFLLCSDGWWEPLSGDEVEECLRQASDPGDWLERMSCLVQGAALKDQDNYSAIAVWFGDMPTR